MLIYLLFFANCRWPPVFHPPLAAVGRCYPICNRCINRARPVSVTNRWPCWLLCSSSSSNNSSSNNNNNSSYFLVSSFILAFPADIGSWVRGFGGNTYMPARAIFAGDLYTLANGTADGTTWGYPYESWQLSVTSMAAVVFIISKTWWDYYHASCNFTGTLYRYFIIIII